MNSVLSRLHSLRLPLRHQRQIALAFPILCLIATATTFGWYQIKNEQAQEWVSHTKQVRLASTELLSGLLQAETGYRGYYLTQNRELLQPSNQAIAALPQALNDLETRVSDNPAQVKRVRQIRPLVLERLALLQDTLKLVDAQPGIRVQPEFRAQLLEGKRLMDRAKLAIAEFIAEEERLQVERDRVLKQQRQIAWTLLLLLVGGGVGGSFLAVFAVRYLEQRVVAQEQDLQESQARYQLLVENFPNGTVALIDRDQRFLLINGLGLAKEGFTPAQLTGKTIGEALPASVCRRVKPIYQRVLAGEPMVTELPFGERTIEFHALPVRSRAGEVIAAMVMTQDITERKQAEAILRQTNEQLEARVAERTTELAHSNQRLMQLAAIVQSSGDAILSLTLDGTIVSWNQGSETLFGYSATDIIGQPSTVIMPVDRQQEHAQILQRLTQDEATQHYETVRQRQDGSLVDVSLTVSPIKDAEGMLVGISKIARDVTQRKQAEAQLHLSAERLSLANAELARAARLKDEFLAGMSHELRTPLNAVLGLSEALLEEVYGDLNLNQKESIQTIEQSGNHLLSLINDILDLSKIESGKMELQLTPVSVQSLCESSLNFVKQQAMRKQIRLSCQVVDGLTEIEVDDRRLRQVLVNLLSNAVKFTPENGNVWFKAEGDPLYETVEFSVTDTGIGIAPDNIEKIFKPFVQLDSSLSRRYSGTGLGLSLVQRITELHGGSVILESEVGKGSRFIVKLPWRQPSSSVETQPPPELAISKIRQALVVEDSEVAANQIARYLTELGSKVLVHPQGEGTTDVALQSKPDVIILDILLPDQSGWEVLTRLKANAALRDIPVVVVSVMDERSHGLELGASAYLVKPIDRQELQQTLSQVLEQTETERSQTALVVAPAQLSDTPLILLAEDNEANISLMKNYLTSRGFQVVLARNGLEAIQMAKQHQPDLVLMDIQMPEMDGLEATRRLRSDPSLSAMPIIALTALAMPGDRDRCLTVGITEYMTKPVSLHYLIQLIGNYLPIVKPEELESGG